MRLFIVVMDGVGIGELPDAHRYGDEGSNTLGNTVRVVGKMEIPNLMSLGLGELVPELPGESRIIGAYGKMVEKSVGKDTLIGHWEMMGIITVEDFPTYPDGFPSEVISRFEAEIGRKVLGNKPASGTEIIKELGELHMKTGYPIVYTSADSVFQIAAHEEIIPVEELYNYCRIARRILAGKHGVARVIARPFLGTPGNFYRTERRKDFSLPPPEKTALDLLVENGITTIGLGKIEDIFSNQGLAESNHTHNNEETMSALIEIEKNREDRLMVFANLSDFDTIYAHRNNPRGLAEALERFDVSLGEAMSILNDEDLLIVCADHGNDPTTPSTDHSREYTPLLVKGRKDTPVYLGVRETFADVGATALEFFGIGEHKFPGKSFLDKLR
ncbi:MAG TPA: phosphopentomutase [bacterium]|nr:phosphopentomutase [bacterium]HOL54893.1 phosphopentomutase [bacterium]HPO81392.1 phosphopentomutase [bacterium]